MAGAHDDYHRGDMEISEQRATYAVFMGMAKWGSLFTASSLLALTLWFCTGADFWSGLFQGAIGFVVLMVVGWFLLRGKPEAH
jgi:hypothetical protein